MLTRSRVARERELIRKLAESALQSATRLATEELANGTDVAVNLASLLQSAGRSLVLRRVGEVG